MISLGLLGRRLTLLALLLGGDAGLWGALAADRSVDPHQPLSTLLTGLAAWTLQAAALWLTGLLVLLVAEPFAGRELTAYAACPAGLRRLLVLACGAIALGVVAAPVQAAGSHPPGAPTPHARVDGLPLPDRTADSDGRPRAADSAAVTVRPGDCLWHVARARLVAEHPGHAPTDAEIDRAWRSWYSANRDVVGDDPDLVLPGTRLRAPGTEPTRP